MSVLGLSFMTYGLGLLGLAAGLFLLQRLRVRHREVPVVTTLFWQQATEARRARVFVERFRHPWAYALFLLIAGLLWTAFAQPATEQDGDVAHVILLDGSAGMAVGDRFEEAGRARGGPRRESSPGCPAGLAVHRHDRAAARRGRRCALAREASRGPQRCSRSCILGSRTDPPGARQERGRRWGHGGRRGMHLGGACRWRRAGPCPRGRVAHRPTSRALRPRTLPEGQPRLHRGWRDGGRVGGVRCGRSVRPHLGDAHLMALRACAATRRRTAVRGQGGLAHHPRCCRGRAHPHAERRRG